MHRVDMLRIDGVRYGRGSSGCRRCWREQKTRPPPRVVLPEQQLLVVDELGALTVDQLAPEVLVLEQVEEVQAHRVLKVLGVLGLLPVEQVLEVVDECGVLEVASLSQDCNTEEGQWLVRSGGFQTSSPV